MYIIKCNCCGRVINKSGSQYDFSWWNRGSEDTSDHKNNFDLCDDCHQKFQEDLKNKWGAFGERDDRF